MAHLLTLLGSRFTPREISGLTIWLDAQDTSTLTFNSTTVSQWSDKSGKGNHATQGTALAQPKYVASGIGGRPALEGRHDGSNASQMAITDNASLDYTAFTHFTVFQRVSDMGAQEHISGKYSTSGNRREHRIYVDNSDRPSCIVSPDGTSVGTSTPFLSGVGTGTPYILKGGFSGGTTSVRINNGAPATATTAATVYNGTANVELFSRDGASLLEPYAGRIGEVLFFSRALSEGERLAVLSYLAGKWGVAV